MPLFYELLQVAVGSREMLSHIPTSVEWSDIYAVSQKQSLVGVCFQGINNLYLNNPEVVVNLPGPLKLKWLGMALEIQRGNALILQRARELTKSFADAGYRTTVLKGLGVSEYYPDPTIRQGGDIDLWVDAPRRKLISYLRSRGIRLAVLLFIMPM